MVGRTGCFLCFFFCCCCCWWLVLVFLFWFFCFGFVVSWVFCMSYVELQVTSNFSFRIGGSHPEELIDHAADLRYDAIALTDRNTFAGIVRAYVIAKERGIRFIPACRLDLL